MSTLPAGSRSSRHRASAITAPSGIESLCAISYPHLSHWRIRYLRPRDFLEESLDVGSVHACWPGRQSEIIERHPAFHNPGPGIDIEEKANIVARFLVTTPWCWEHRRSEGVGGLSPQNRLGHWRAPLLERHRRALSGRRSFGDEVDEVHEWIESDHIGGIGDEVG